MWGRGWKVGKGSPLPLPLHPTTSQAVQDVDDAELNFEITVLRKGKLQNTSLSKIISNECTIELVLMATCPIFLERSCYRFLCWFLVSVLFLTLYLPPSKSYPSFKVQLKTYLFCKVFSWSFQLDVTILSSEAQ